MLWEFRKCPQGRVKASESRYQGPTRGRQGPESPGRSPPGKARTCLTLNVVVRVVPRCIDLTTQRCLTQSKLHRHKMVCFHNMQMALCTNSQLVKLGEEWKPLVPATLELSRRSAEPKSLRPAWTTQEESPTQKKQSVYSKVCVCVAGESP